MRTGMKQYLPLLEIKLELGRGANPGIATTLHWIFRDRLATNPRDKVYSLLALLQLDVGEREPADIPNVKDFSDGETYHRLRGSRRRRLRQFSRRCDI
jgi:hypothetical protein